MLTVITPNEQVVEITFAFSRSCYQKKRNRALKTEYDKNNSSGAARDLYRVSRCRYHIASKRKQVIPDLKAISIQSSIWLPAIVQVKRDYLYLSPH